MNSSSRHARHGSASAGLRGVGWLLLGLGAALSLLLVLGSVLLTIGNPGRDRGIGIGIGTGNASRPRPTLTHSISARRSTPPSSASGSASRSSSTSATQLTPPAPQSAPPTPQPLVDPAPGPATGLPVPGFLGSASQLITVSAASTSSTTATVQAWTRQGTRWVRYGPGVPGELGSAGLTTHPSEQTPATPIGSFSLTQAFGAKANPGTALPYLRTTPPDWWISQPGPLYNTHQRCASHCPFVQAAPNQQLRYLTPADDYAVVIDYNTANAGPVRQGAGSAFFLQVSDGRPTAGCVSIPEERLIALLRWLKPSGQPRILIGSVS